MSPEERAEELEAHWGWDGNIVIPPAALVSAIRDVENDALERAARAVEEPGIYLPGKGRLSVDEQHVLQHATRRIRSLKSTPRQAMERKP